MRAKLGEGLEAEFSAGYLYEYLDGGEGCPRQIVEYSKLVYGFQCHMEFNRDVIELLIAHSEGGLATLVDHKYVQQPDALRRNDYLQMNEALFAFLDKLAHEYEAQR